MLGFESVAVAARSRGVVAALWVIVMTNAVSAGPPVRVTSVEGITEYRLENGLQVLLFPDHSKPQVTVNMTVFVGSRHEGYGEAGMAHLLEHMLFKGTPDHPQIPKVLKDHGAEFNGTTWLDRTNYYETLPATPDNLEFAIRLEADRLVNSNVRGEDLASEMTVVRNEFERGENSPTRVLDQRIMSAAYEWHNYGKSTIGNRADIERVPVESLKQFYKKHYQPDNAMLIVAGNFEEEQALQLTNEHFGKLPRSTIKRDDTYTEEPAQDGERTVILRRVGDVAFVGALYHICAGPHPDYVAIDVLDHALTSSPSGRLYKALVETRRVSRINGSAYGLHDPGVFKITAEVATGNDPQDILATIAELSETLSEGGVKPEEVERARTSVLKDWELIVNSSQQVALQLSEWAAQGDWRLLFLYRDRMEKITTEQVNAAAAKYLRRNNRTAGMFIPTKQAERVAIPATPQLAEMIGEYKGRELVSAGEVFDVSPQSIESRTQRLNLSSGLKAVLLPKKTRGGSVQMRLNLRYGNLENLKGRVSACEVLPALMMRGTAKLNRLQIQDELDKNRGRISPSGAVGEAHFAIETRREQLPAVLAVLKQILREPTLPADELEIIRNQKLTGLETQLTDPQALAQVAVSRRLSPYEADDIRYVPSLEQSVERWKKISRDDVAALYTEFFNGSNGELAIVGDFDPKVILPLVEEITAGWKSARPYARIPRKGDVKVTDDRHEIRTPDKENAVYFAGTVLPINDSSADYPALVIGNNVLGSGGLSSRLGDRVRQKEGLSYGVGSMLRSQSIDQRTAFYVYAITNPANMRKVEKAIREELERILASGVTDSELADAKNGWTEKQKVDRAEDGGLCSLLADTAENGRDMSYYTQLESQVLSLTTAQVHAALKERLQLNRLGVVVAGDFAKVENDEGAKKKD